MLLPRVLAGALLTLAADGIALAQDPYKILPKNYSLEFENDWVIVSRVRYFPGDRLSVHSHPSSPTVYVYLTDGGPIRFTHIEPKFTVERPPVKAGGVRFNRNAQVETHEVSYLGDAPTEYLRITLKTEPGARHRDARLRAAFDFPWEDEQVRISRVAEEAAVPHLTRPAVVVSVPQRTYRFVNPAANSADIPGSTRPLIVLELKTDPARIPTRGN